MDGPLSTSATADAEPLTWAPPACGDAEHGCVDLYLSDIGTNQTPDLSAVNDYRIHLPSTPLHRRASDPRRSQRHRPWGARSTFRCRARIRARRVTGSTSRSRPAARCSSRECGSTIPRRPITQSTGDGIDVGDPASSPSDIVLENVRVDGISGARAGQITPTCSSRTRFLVRGSMSTA